jgi:predicted nucleotidyltransferase
LARCDATDSSDADVVIQLSPENSEGGFAYFGRLEALTQRLQKVTGCPVDLVMEPVRKERLRRIIARDATVPSEKRVQQFGDILENITRIERFAAGLDADGLARNEQAFYAVCTQC